MDDKTKLEILSREIKLLEKLLDTINPNWHLEILHELADDGNCIIEDGCIQIRAAIKYLQESNNQQRTAN